MNDIANTVKDEGYFNLITMECKILFHTEGTEEENRRNQYNCNICNESQGTE